MKRVNDHLTGHGCRDVYRDYKNGDKFYIHTIPFKGSGYRSLNALERDNIAKYSGYTRGYNKIKEILDSRGRRIFFCFCSFCVRRTHVLIFCFSDPIVFLPIHNTYHIRQIHTKGELNKEMSEKQYVNGGIIYGQEKRI